MQVAETSGDHPDQIESPYPHWTTYHSDTTFLTKILFFMFNLNLSHCILRLLTLALPSGATEKNLDSMIFTTPLHSVSQRLLFVLPSASSPH